MKRHDTLTRRIQDMRRKAAQKTDLPAASDLLLRQRERAKAARAARKDRGASVVEISKGAVA
jgi:hypothetical protein